MRIPFPPSLRGSAFPAFPAAAFGLALLLRPDPALAQLATGGSLNDAIDAMRIMLETSGDTLRVRAQQLLLSLVVLDLVWRGGRWALSGQSVAEFAEPMIYTVAIVTLAWAFTSAVPEVVGWLAATATELTHVVAAGQSEAYDPGDLTPSGMVSNGIKLILEWERRIDWHPNTWLYLVCVFFSVIVLAIKLAMTVVIYAELYIVGLIGILALGFAGLAQTRAVAKGYVMALFAKGFKLLTLLILVDATERLARSVATPDIGGAMSSIVLQVLGATMIMILPGAVEKLVGGSAVGDMAGGAAAKVGGMARSAVTVAGATAVGAAGGAVAGAATGAAAAAKTAGAGALTGGINPDALKKGAAAALGGVAKGAPLGALKGGVNWGASAMDGKLRSELGEQLRGRVNRVGTGKAAKDAGKAGKEGSGK